MKFLDLLRMSSSSLWKRKVRTLLTVLGVVIGTASIIVMISLGLGMNKTMMEQIEKFGGLTTINVFEGGGGGGGGNFMAFSQAASASNNSGKEQKRLDDKVVEELKQIEHVDYVSPVLSITPIIRQGAYQTTWTSVQGMSIEALEKLNIEFASGSMPKPGDPLSFIYGNTVVRDFTNIKTGKGYWETNEAPNVDFVGQPMFVIFDTDAYYDSQGNQNRNTPGNDNTGKQTKPPKKYMIPTAGLMAGGLEDFSTKAYGIYCDIDALKLHLKKAFKNKAIPGQPTKSGGKPYKEIFYNSITVNVDNMEYMAAVQKLINDMGYQAQSNAEWMESEQERSRTMQAVLGGIGAVSLFVAAIGITNTMMMSIYERTKEIGIIKVLGCSLGNIRSMFLMEAAYIGFIGGLAGILLSYLISFIINKVAAGMYGGESTISFIPVWLSIAGLGFAVLVGMTAGFFPALRAMKLSPLAAIRNE